MSVIVPGDMAPTEVSAVMILDGLLEVLEDVGGIAEYGHCYGVPAFDVQLPDGRWLQLTVSPQGTMGGWEPTP